MPLLGGLMKHVRPGSAVPPGAKVLLDGSTIIHNAITANLATVCRGKMMGAYTTLCQELRSAKGWADGNIDIHVTLDGGRPDLKGALAERRRKAVAGLAAIDEATAEKLGLRPSECGTDGCDCRRCSLAHQWDLAHAKYVCTPEYAEGLKAHLAAVAHRKSIDMMPWMVRACRTCNVSYSVAPMEAEDQIMATEADIAVGYDADYLVKNANPKTRTIVLLKGSMSGTRVQRAIKLKHLDDPARVQAATKTATNDARMDTLLLEHGRDALRRLAKLDHNDYNVGLMPTGFGTKTAIKATAASYTAERKDPTLTECQAMAEGVAAVMTGVDVDATTEVLEMVTLLYDHHAVFDSDTGTVQMAAPFDPDAFQHHDEEEAHTITGMSRHAGTKYAADDAIDYGAFSRGEIDPRTYQAWGAELLPPGGLGGGEEDDVLDVLCYRDGSSVPEDDEPPADLDKWKKKKCEQWLKSRGFSGYSGDKVHELRDHILHAYDLGLITIKSNDFEAVHQERYRVDTAAWDGVARVRLHGTPLELEDSKENYECPVCPPSVVASYFEQREADTLRNRTQGLTRDVRDFRYLVEKPAPGSKEDASGCKPCKVSGTCEVGPCSCPRRLGCI